MQIMKNGLILNRSQAGKEITQMKLEHRTNVRGGGYCYLTTVPSILKVVGYLGSLPVMAD